MSKIFLTQEGFDKLEKELEFLKNDKRIEIAEKLKEAISFGDLSENAEYEEARNEQAHIETRIIELEEQLKNVELIDEKETTENKIRIGTLVTVSSLSDAKLKDVEYKIVGTTESDILAEPAKISNESPIGKVLLGKKKGDKVKVKSPSGTKEFQIIDIK